MSNLAPANAQTRKARGLPECPWMDCKCRVPPDIDTFAPGDLETLYQTAHDQGIARFLFYDGSVDSAQCFADMVRAGNLWTYAGFCRASKEPLALSIVEPFSGRSAFMHFAFFKGMGIAQRHGIGRAFLRLLFQDREKGLSCVCGLTPAPFRHAWGFALELGFKKLGRIPGACPVPDRKTGSIRHVPGILTMYTPTECRED